MPFSQPPTRLFSSPCPASAYHFPREPEPLLCHATGAGCHRNSQPTTGSSSLIQYRHASRERSLASGVQYCIVPSTVGPPQRLGSPPMTRSAGPPGAGRSAIRNPLGATALCLSLLSPWKLLEETCSLQTPRPVTNVVHLYLETRPTTPWQRRCCRRRRRCCSRCCSSLLTASRDTAKVNRRKDFAFARFPVVILVARLPDYPPASHT